MEGANVGRFYTARTVISNGIKRHYVLVRVPGRQEVEVDVSLAVLNEIDNLQKEYWKLERRESRHTLHIDNLEKLTCHEDVYFEQDEPSEDIKAIAHGLAFLSPLQRRRLVGHTLTGMSIADLAESEGCSERAIKYSIAAARRNLKKYFQKIGRSHFTS